MAMLKKQEWTANANPLAALALAAGIRLFLKSRLKTCLNIKPNGVQHYDFFYCYCSQVTLVKH